MNHQAEDDDSEDTWRVSDWDPSIEDLDRPHWLLPKGVSHGTWEYVQSQKIAEQYDDYFQFNDLFEFDMRMVREALEEHGSKGDLIADLGVGTGRAIVPLVELGYEGLAVDLSQRMLDMAKWKAKQASLPLHCLRANLVELDALADNAVDHGICLFSTLGMIRGHEARLQAVKHFRRIIKDSGVFVLHVHNFWFNLRDPGGPWWVFKNIARSVWDKDLERGDKYYPYRGLSRMFLHVFTQRELSKLLRDGGFRKQKFIYLHTTRQKELPRPWLIPSVRANGWIVVCQ